MAKAEVTVTMWEYPENVKALFGLHDMFRNSEEAGEDSPYKRIVPEPIRFARYLLDHPEELKTAQEISEWRERAWKEHLAKQPPEA